ncbi:TonB-dependent receptor [Jiulongibacter sediminis]|jgi:TonB-linked SusC/RagA family outer membrane protein|uniref:SusC/RagA family TonB-linked outer membrane protein n=1 Tax=Jiulongibacter sediminis TaxID=1605367 RepID=UPI0026EA01D6|nr:TonB-dependent receptor [Jiulongibacter sediminis]
MKVKLYLRYFLLVTMSVAVTLSSAFAQGRKVSGKVVGSDDNLGIPGASVVIQGTSTGTTTDVDGNYSIDVRGNNDVLVVSFVGYNTQTVTVGNQSVINFTLETDVNSLEEIVVTGYQQIRKKDITGAVTVVDAEELSAVKSSSFIQNLAGRASGLNVSTSGKPGDATNIRIRGISSFTSNDPLYVIDGVPTVDKYQNTINPNDIESIQVLKDASAASIYGSRASNGVIVITTKSGKAGKAKLTYNGSVGFANPVKGYDEVLNLSSEYYADAVRLKLGSDTPAWFATPGTLPRYVHDANNIYGNIAPGDFDPINNIVTETNQVGTNWWDEITRTAQINDHNLNVSGGNDVATYNVSGSYLNQEGIMNFTQFNRATLRANSTFKVGKRLTVGENLMFANNWSVLDGGQNSEFSIMGQVIKSTPVVSVENINGGPGGHVAATTGNFTNPTQVLIDGSNNTNTTRRVLGNFFAELQIVEGLKFRTNFGADFGQNWGRSFTYEQPYRAEGPKTPASRIFNERWDQSTNWNITNTFLYNNTFGKHQISGLAGQEAISNKYRQIFGQLAGYFTTDVNAWYLNTALGDPASRSVSSFGNEAKLASYFGKVDYTFDDKYLISATVRRDGSSKFTPEKRYGIFPAVSVGWRLSQESFMQDLTWLSDFKLRASYGELGNQQIRNYNFASIYGGAVGTTFYDINGTNSGAATGYAQTSFGNPNTTWETSKTRNIGFDAGLFNNSINVVLDVYSRSTSDLLFNPALPGTAGAASPPFVNVGSMLNKGFDLSANWRKSLSNDFGINLGLNLSHYKNTIERVSGDQDFFYPDGTGLNSRIPNSGISVRNEVGHSISSFYGYVVDGLITNEAELATHTGTGGSAIGGLKFRDVNGDGEVTGADTDFIGNPHPKLTGGLNIGLNYKNFDLTSFWFGSYGNDIFTGYWIQSYFMNFNANVLNNILENQGKIVDGKAWPAINGQDRSSPAVSSFYVQDGSYLRMTNLQLAYNLPASISSKIGASNARLYVQGQNLITLTNYFGTDPNVSNANIGGGVNDGGMGLDNGNYPANKQWNLGISLEF